MSRLEIGLVAGLCLVWVPGVLELSGVWAEVEYASHGFLIPLVAAWAATAHRVQLASLAPQPIRFGFVWLGITMLGYLLALALENVTLIGLVAVATVVVVVLALRGVEWVSVLRFPLGYLLFMVPLPSAWVTPLIVSLQLVVSRVAVWILQSLGVSIYREGNVLELPGGATLFVAEACSGITSLITLIPIGVFIAYFTESKLSRRLVLVLAVVPIALAANLLRVLLTTETAIWFDVETATSGPLHEWFGVATYVVGCVTLLLLGVVMRRLWPDDSSQARPA